MPKTSSYSVDAVELTLEFQADAITINQLFELPLATFGYSMALNTIPIGVATVNAGREATNLDKSSPIHAQLLNTLRAKTYVKVKAKITSSRQNAEFLEDWPKDPFIIFEGNTAGCSWQQSEEGGAVFTLRINHWLADLSESSAISPLFHPASPAAFQFAAVLIAEAGGALADGQASNAKMLLETVAASYFFTSTPQVDLWAGAQGAAVPPEGEGIRGWLRKLASGGLFKEGARPLAFDEVPALEDLKNSNQPALDAINRFEPRDGEGYRAGVPLELITDEDAAGATTVAESIADAAAQAVDEGIANRTLWDLLLHYAQMFHFAVVPLVSRALLVPFTPCLRDHWRTIRADEYSVVSWTDDGPKRIFGVGLYGGVELESLPQLAADGGLNYRDMGIGGAYIDTKNLKGTFLLTQAPPWIFRLLRDEYTGSAAPNNVRAIPTALTPLLPGLPDIPLPPADFLLKRVSLADRLAQAVYAEEVVRGRSVAISGRLRLDICPGSIVKVEIPSEKFIEDDKLGDAMFATVRQVSVHLDAQTPGVVTTFQLGDLRTSAENAADSSLSLASPPLWKKPWKGAPLIDEMIDAGLGEGREGDV